MQQEIKREQGWLYLSTRLKQVADDDLATSIYFLNFPLTSQRKTEQRKA